jgi:hypothetical protein
MFISVYARGLCNQRDFVASVFSSMPKQQSLNFSRLHFKSMNKWTESKASVVSLPRQLAMASQVRVFEWLCVPPNSITANELPAEVMVRAFDSHAEGRVRIPPWTRTSIGG